MCIAIERRIPALVVGILLFLSIATTFSADTQYVLIASLFADGDYDLCLRECDRALASDSCQESIRLTRTRCRIKLDRSDKTDTDQLSQLTAHASTTARQALASYELGRIKWINGEEDAAAIAFSRAFFTARNERVFLHSACSLFLMFSNNPELAEQYPGLRMQINSTRDLWTAQLLADSARSNRRRGGKLLAIPGLVVTAIYRSFVRPAIGQRCALYPSCSEYFLRACRKHGLLGFSIVADRFFREPTVTQRQAKPLSLGATIRYADPLSDHDFWMTE